MQVLDQIRESAPAQTTILIALAVALIGVAVYLYIRSRVTPKEREHRRRMSINQNGRIGDAMITDVHDNVVFYEYSIRGVLYTTSQDISDLREHITSDPDRLIGPCGLKYTTNNPANSIIVCEEWSGLRINSPLPASPPPELSSPQGV